MNTKTKIDTINLTPSWESILPTLLLLMQDGNAEGRKTAATELNRMAKLADLYVASHAQR